MDNYTSSKRWLSRLLLLTTLLLLPLYSFNGGHNQPQYSGLVAGYSYGGAGNGGGDGYGGGSSSSGSFHSSSEGSGSSSSSSSSSSTEEDSGEDSSGSYGSNSNGRGGKHGGEGYNIYSTPAQPTQSSPTSSNGREPETTAQTSPSSSATPDPGTTTPDPGSSTSSPPETSSITSEAASSTAESTTASSTAPESTSTSTSTSTSASTTTAPPTCADGNIVLSGNCTRPSGNNALMSYRPQTALNLLANTNGDCTCDAGFFAQFFTSVASNDPNNPPNPPGATSTCPNFANAGLVDVDGNCWKRFGTPGQSDPQVTGYDFYPFCEGSTCFVYAVPQCPDNGNSRGVRVEPVGQSTPTLTCNQVMNGNTHASTLGTGGIYIKVALFNCDGCSPKCTTCTDN